MMLRFKPLIAALYMTCIVSSPLWADDTEMFVMNFSGDGSANPKVLIIYDNSGSMLDNSLDVKEGYLKDENGNAELTDYPALGSDNSLDNDFIYFTVGGIDDSSYVPEGRRDDRRFIWDINNCASSYIGLAERGYYSGYFRELVIRGSSGSWESVRLNEGANYTTIDCLDDFDLNTDGEGNLLDDDDNPISYSVTLQASDGSFYEKTISTINPGRYRRSGNAYDPSPQGYSINASGRDIEDYYTFELSATELTKDSFSEGSTLSLYAPNYLRWYHGEDIAEVNLTRRQVAENAMNNALSAISGVDFALMVFNYNYRNRNACTHGECDGGRIIKNFATNNSDEINATIQSIVSRTSTPLAETLLEAKRFLAGEAVYYGDDNHWNPSSDYPSIERDMSVESSGTYISPFSVGCDEKIKILYITDGAPHRDVAANTDITALPVESEFSGCDGSTVSDCTWGSAFSILAAADPNVGSNTTSYLAALAKWMNSQDINTTMVGKQNVIIDTVGFDFTPSNTDYESTSTQGTTEDLLKLAASYGGGTYYSAQSGVELEKALHDSVLNIFDKTTSLVSPAVATNNFDRTRSLDNLYYAMFKPELTSRWAGNLKKLKMSGGAFIADKDGYPAIGTSGAIIPEAKTYWGNIADGNDVSLGGTRAMLSKKSTRNVLFDLNSTGLLSAFNKSNLITRAGGDEELSAYLRIAEISDILRGEGDDELNRHINWMLGQDADDDDMDLSTTIRQDIMGDPLHSRPIAINYGRRTGSDEDSTDADDMDIRILVSTNAGNVHMFADSGDNVDESWAFMPYELLHKQILLRNNRRSSAHVYGMDGNISVWTYDVDGDGQYGSTGDKVWAFMGMRRGGNAYYGLDITNPDSPKLMWRIDSSTFGMEGLGQTWSTPTVGYMPGYSKPVLFVGGGYDTNQDLAEPASDNLGKGVYILDAETGTKKWQLSDTRLRHSIPSQIATLDSDGDGAVDRLYFGDMGGNVWRVDLYGSETSKWKLTQLAALSDETDLAERRKFFAAPAVVRTYLKKITTIAIEGGSTIVDSQQLPYDAVLIGSGDRTKPVTNKGGQAVNNHYYMLRDHNVNTMDVSSIDTDDLPSAIIPSELYNITSDPIGAAGELAVNTELEALGAARGWVYNLLEDGEKSFSSGIVLAGDVYFTSYIPEAPDTETCSIASIGVGRTYLVNMHFGTTVNAQRYYDMRDRVYDDISIMVVDDTNGDPVVKLPDLPSDEHTTDNCEGSACDRVEDNSVSRTSDGAMTDDMDMSPQQIYMYFEENR